METVTTADKTIVLTNAAVFKGRKKMAGGATIVTEGPILRVMQRDRELYVYEIVAVAKAGMAWDVKVPGREDVMRLVAQLGCGCGGMKRYANDPEYAGTIQP